MIVCPRLRSAWLPELMSAGVVCGRRNALGMWSLDASVGIKTAFNYRRTASRTASPSGLDLAFWTFRSAGDPPAVASPQIEYRRVTVSPMMSPSPSSRPSARQNKVVSSMPGPAILAANTWKSPVDENADAAASMVYGPLPVQYSPSRKPSTAALASITLTDGAS